MNDLIVANSKLRKSLGDAAVGKSRWKKRSVVLAVDMSSTERKEEAPSNAQDLTAFVQNLLDQMQSRFNQMSDQIITKIDDMGARIDDLERSIGELMQQAGVENPDGQHGLGPGDGGRK